MADHGPAELVLTAAVARRYYLHGQAKTEIADDLGISRFKVARLLDAARAEGLVKIEIVRQGAFDVDLSARLQETLGLRHTVVLDCAALETRARRAQIGRAAAELLAEVTTPDDVLGLPWSRTVRTMVDALVDLPPVDVVQLTGAFAHSEEDSSAVDIVRRAARTGGGQPHLFFAPFVLDDAELSATLRRQPAVAAALSQISRVTRAVVGVGALAEGESTIYDVATPDDRRLLAEAGAVGEAAGVFFDREGRPVTTDLTTRLITLSAEQLHDIPEVLALSTGPARAEAVAAAVRGELVNGVVCDTELAEALLDQDVETESAGA